jgi:NitT/TauT family transport system permease protein
MDLRRISFLSFILLACIWCLFTYSGWIDPLFLPTPGQVLKSGYQLFAEENFAYDVLLSTWRVLLGFGLSCVLAIPLGVWIGTSKRADAVCTPVLNFIRYMPAPAFIPLLILWLGIGIGIKVALIFISIFFYLTSLVAEGIRNIDQDCVETALTLGATRFQVLLRVVLPAANPAIWQSMRIMMGVAWTSIIIVELIAAQRGIGAMIIRAQRFLQTPKIIAGIVFIGILGIVFDRLFRFGYWKFFPWLRQEELANGD